MNSKKGHLKLSLRVIYQQGIELFDPILFIILPRKFEYSTLRHVPGFLWKFLLVVAGYLIVSMYAFPIFISSWKKVFRSYFICLAGYAFFAARGTYNVFRPIDYPFMVYPLLFFLFKYKLFFLFIQNNENYMHYVTLSIFFDYIGKSAFLPHYPIWRNSSTEKTYLSCFQQGLLDLTDLKLFSLPSGWLQKVPSHVRIIDLSENFLSTTGITEEDANNFMERWFREEDIVVINLVGNPLEDKIDSPDILHPRLLILSKPLHRSIVSQRIGEKIMVTLPDEIRKIGEQAGWERWTETFVGLNKKMKIAFAWDRCIQKLFSSKKHRQKELLFAITALNLAYSLLNENEGDEIKLESLLPMDSLEN